MTTYFAEFSVVVPMRELTREAALGAGTYVERDGDRCRLFFRGSLGRIAYLDRSDPEAAIAEVRARREGVRAEVYTRVTREGNHARYRTWYLTATGDLESCKEYETDGDGNYLRESWLEPDGSLGTYRIWKYDRDGEPVETLTYNAAGTLVSREDA